jgi:hypothetical protein
MPRLQRALALREVIDRATAHDPVARCRRRALRPHPPGSKLMPRQSGGAVSAPVRSGLLNWKAALGIVISSAALYFTFRRMDLSGVVGELRAADPVLLAASAAAVTFVFWIRAWRWRVILRPIRDTSFGARFAAVAIGFMGNNLLPARIGEFMRALSLSRLEPVPVVASFGSLVVERLLDAIFVIAFLFLATTLPGFPASVARRRSACLASSRASPSAAWRAQRPCSSA